MPVHSRLGLYFYNLANGAVGEYSALCDQLSATATAPGGYGDLTCTLRFPYAELPRAELQMFSNVALMDGTFPVFLGRIDEPATAIDQNGTMIGVHAQGASGCLNDDPVDVTYTAQTAQAILIDQLTSSTLKRNHNLALDQDTSAILPTNPAGTWTFPYNGTDFAQVLQDVCQSLGDYSWAVWGHPNHKDTSGFPTWQLFVHPRDITTIGYFAYLSDMPPDGYDVRPAIEVSFNVVTLHYRDATSGNPASLTVADARLAANGSQGTAPIPWRRFRLDRSQDLLSSTQATALANTVLNLFKNPGYAGYKGTIKLNRVRDANGAEIPLWQVRPDSNLFLPELGKSLGTQLPTAATSGVNLFYVSSISYDESTGQTPTLTLTLGESRDLTSYSIAALQVLTSETQTNAKIRTLTQAVGSGDIVECGVDVHDWGSISGPTSAYFPVPFHALMVHIPSSITYVTHISGNVTSGPFTISTSNNGAEAYFNYTSPIEADWIGQATTNGN